MSNVDVTAEMAALADEQGDKPKTAKQLKKEAEKAAKLQKLQEKLDKKATVPVSSKEKVDVSDTLVDDDDCLF